MNNGICSCDKEGWIACSLGTELDFIVKDIRFINVADEKMFIAFREVFNGNENKFRDRNHFKMTYHEFELIEAAKEGRFFSYKLSLK